MNLKLEVPSVVLASRGLYVGGGERRKGIGLTDRRGSPRTRSQRDDLELRSASETKGPRAGMWRGTVVKKLGGKGRQGLWLTSLCLGGLNIYNRSFGVCLSQSVRRSVCLISDRTPRAYPPLFKARVLMPSTPSMRSPRPPKRVKIHPQYTSGARTLAPRSHHSAQTPSASQFTTLLVIHLLRIQAQVPLVAVCALRSGTDGRTWTCATYSSCAPSPAVTIEHGYGDGSRQSSAGRQ